MRRFHMGLRLAAIGLAMVGAAATAQTAMAPPIVDPMALPNWMAGCWISVGEGDARTEECWTAPRGSMLLGSGHSFAGSRTRSFEHMRIESVDGSLVFVSHPNGAAPTRFVLQAPGASDSLLFVNANHDYPQRVHYWREGAELVAEISLIDGSNAMRWRFRRMGGS